MDEPHEDGITIDSILSLVLRYSFCYERRGVGVWCVPWLGKEGGGCLMGPDEQPSVQKWTITDCHHPCPGRRVR